MANPTIATVTNSNQWQFSETTGELRVYSNETFESVDSQLVLQREETGNVCYKYTLTILGDDFTIPAITTLPPNYPYGQSPRYNAEVWLGTGTNARYGFTYLENFRFPATPLSTTWTTIRSFNEQTASFVRNPTLASTDYVNSVVANYQPLDADLTTIAGLSPSNDDFLQRKSSAWANRTVAQVKADIITISTYSNAYSLDSGTPITGALSSSLGRICSIVSIQSGELMTIGMTIHPTAATAAANTNALVTVSGYSADGTLYKIPSPSVLQTFTGESVFYYRFTSNVTSLAVITIGYITWIA